MARDMEKELVISDSNHSISYSSFGLHGAGSMTTDARLTGIAASMQYSLLNPEQGLSSVIYCSFCRVKGTQRLFLVYANLSTCSSIIAFELRVIFARHIPIASMASLERDLGCIFMMREMPYESSQSRL